MEERKREIAEREKERIYLTDLPHLKMFFRKKILFLSIQGEKSQTVNLMK